MAHGPQGADALTITDSGLIDIDTSIARKSGRVRRGPTGNLADDPRDFISPDRQTPIPDAYTGILQPSETYYTTYQLAKRLKMYPEQVHRYCKQWFGKLPPTRRGKGQGYRIPPHYELVARGWLQTRDPELRRAMKEALVKEPRNFVVVVAGRASTHYTGHEAMERVAQVLDIAENNSEIVSVIYVGPKQGRKKRK